MTECTPDHWFLKLDEGTYIDRLSGTEATIPEGQLLKGRAEGWKTQNEASWKIADPKFLLSAYTSGNRVTPLVDGEAYVKSLVADLSAQRRDRPTFVLMAGWQFSNDFSMATRSEVTGATQLIEVIRGISHRDITARALVFDNLTAPFQNPAFVEAVNVIYSTVGKQPPLHAAQLEKVQGGGAYSHHQKEVFVGSGDFTRCSAYVGGIDLADGRRDNPQHEKTKKDGGFFGWHDVQAKVEGNAVQALWANFAERWDAAEQILKKATSPSYLLQPCPVPTFTDSTPGTHHVQVLRSVADAPTSFKRQRFMPDGELTVLAGLAKAIRNAECYIYIEEQFLWDCELADLIGKQLKDKPGLRLIIVLAAESEFPGPTKLYSYYLRSQFLMRVMGVNSAAEIAFGPKTRVYVYGLYQTLASSPKAVYVHSKLIIVDDRYVAIGSANVNRRSMRIETELTLGIVDATTVPGQLNGNPVTVCQFAKKLREQLWMEHLNLTRLPPDPIQALQLFPQGILQDDGKSYRWPTNQGQAKNSMVHHARCYVNIPGADLFLTMTNRIYDRSERRWRSSRGA